MLDTLSSGKIKDSGKGLEDRSTDFDTHTLLLEVVNQLKIMNMHLSVLTDQRILEGDLNE